MPALVEEEATPELCAEEVVNTGINTGGMQTLQSRQGAFRKGCACVWAKYDNRPLPGDGTCAEREQSTENHRRQRFSSVFTPGPTF